ncbi:37995_t:CDS:2, partial [Gigaspora margarita]
KVKPSCEERQLEVLQHFWYPVKKNGTIKCKDSSERVKKITPIVAKIPRSVLIRLANMIQECCQATIGTNDEHMNILTFMIK